MSQLGVTQRRLAFYGDDFTGSTDVMEVLQWCGLRTVLFLAPPSAQQLDEFADLQAFGVAGWSRSMSPDEMQTELTEVFQKLRDAGAGMVHYKTCSTFDSSAEVGSIGKAIELGREAFGTGVVPMVIGAPNLGRYQVFGNLFARSGLDSEPYRLDRHPTMRQHPITPMPEADLRQHLALQTKLRVGLMDILRLNDPVPSSVLESTLPAGCEILLFDVLYPEQLVRIGQWILALAQGRLPTFVVGSSGIEYALTAAWSSRASVTACPVAASSFPAVEQLVAITGSCSPVNARQVQWAERHGFETVAVDPSRLIQPPTMQAEIDHCVEQAVRRLRAGGNVILHTSRGPEDPRVGRTINSFRALGLSDLEVRLQSGRRLGPLLGKILGGILSQYPLARVGVAGGDTSGYIARQLQLTALEAIAPVAPGSPLCRAYAANEFNGIEFFFKGGQVGKDNVWGTILHGSNWQADTPTPSIQSNIY